MGQTKQGNIKLQYHHIEAPTKQDDEWGKLHKQRKLLNPMAVSDDIEPYRTSELQMLAEAEYPFWVKRKLDGTNMRVHWDGEQALWNGKSNSATFGADVSEYMNSTFLEEIFEEKFGRDIDVTLYGEGMGPKIQGNELGLKSFEFVLFDAKINEVFLEPDKLSSIAEYFGVKTVYNYMADDVEYAFHMEALGDVIDAVSNGEYKDWEGVVAEPVAGLRDRAGERIVVKIKNRDYYKEENGNSTK